MNFSDPKKILVAPLDWGLGHATRCIPIIRELQRSGCRVFIASEGQQAALLQEAFPHASHLSLPGYRMSYSDSSATFGIKMVLQLPKLRSAIHRENKWLQDFVRKYRPDGIISDNRFGLYHPDVPSVIMTHQLRIPSPFPGQPENWLQKVNYHYIKNFTGCWVIDFEGIENLAGPLSHPDKLPPLPVKYTGALSRFEIRKGLQEKYDLLVLISGPEPQRGRLEYLIREQVRQLSLKTLVVTGQPDKPHEEQLSPTARVVHHLDGHTLGAALQQSRMIIARSGYTTIMDLVKLQKKAILIPTPGQTEQEYLAQTLRDKGCFLTFPQKSFNLEKALSEAGDFTFRPLPVPEMKGYQKVVQDFVARL